MFFISLVYWMHACPQSLQQARDSLNSNLVFPLPLNSSLYYCSALTACIGARKYNIYLTAEVQMEYSLKYLALYPGAIKDKKNSVSLNVNLLAPAVLSTVTITTIICTV